MQLISFPEQTKVIAENQPEYSPLPAHRFRHEAEGRIACCWRLTWRERFTLLFTGKVWHQVLTFGHSLQPQKLTIEKPEFRVLVNPYSGKPRHPSDINSDPYGVLMVDPDKALRAATRIPSD
jgi:hypothetical protein